MLFSQFEGQDEVKNYLVRSILTNTVSHGYLFEGSKGIGKMDMARLFAKSLQCLDFNGEPCEKCNSCIKSNSNNHPDIHFLEAVKNVIKRENVDTLIESVSKKAYEGKRKIYIIKDSHLMTPEAANTFLKTLEEPMGETVVIMLTTNSELLISTIVSRCQKVKFKNATVDFVKEHIISKYGLTHDRAKLIAYCCDGILSKAEAIIKNEDNTLEKRLEIIKLYSKIISSDKDIIFELENYFKESKDEINDIIGIIIIWLRDVYFVKYELNDLIVNLDCIDLLNRHVEKLRNQDINQVILYLTKVKRDINNSVNYRLVIDNMLMKLQEEVTNG